MAMVDVELRMDAGHGAPQAADDLIDDANERIEHFVRSRRDSDPIPAFVACDFTMVCQALAEVTDRGLATGDRFCEWGAGFGVVAGLAATLGFESCGIEIHRDLVDEATDLMDAHGLEVTIAHGSLIPDDGDALVDALAQQAWLQTGERSGYDELDYEVEDFDVIFAYPWPGDEQLIDRLFEKYAAVGALLLSYHGVNEMRLQRKTG